MPLCLRSFSQFLSTPSARRATKPLLPIDNAQLISIHALREEGDAAGTFNEAEQKISIHALREEGDSSLLLTSEQL